jgi:hypothetical protein
METTMLNRSRIISRRPFLIGAAAILAAPAIARAQLMLTGVGCGGASCNRGGGTAYDVTLLPGTGDPGWGGYTFVQVIPAANLDAVSGTQMRVSVFANMSITETATIYVGQKAAAGDAYDFNGNQVQLLWSTSGTLAGSGASTTFVSDWVTLGEAFDEAKDYVIAAQFTSNGGACTVRFAAKSGDSNYYKLGADAATTNKSGYTANQTDKAELISKIEIQ